MSLAYCSVALMIRLLRPHGVILGLYTPPKKTWKALVCSMGTWYTWTTLCKCTRMYHGRGNGAHWLSGTKIYASECTSLHSLTMQPMHRPHIDISLRPQQHELKTNLNKLASFIVFRCYFSELPLLVYHDFVKLRWPCNLSAAMYDLVYLAQHLSVANTSNMPRRTRCTSSAE